MHGIFVERQKIEFPEFEGIFGGRPGFVSKTSQNV